MISTKLAMPFTVYGENGAASLWRCATLSIVHRSVLPLCRYTQNSSKFNFDPVWIWPLLSTDSETNYCERCGKSNSLFTDMEEKWILNISMYPEFHNLTFKVYHELLRKNTAWWLVSSERGLPDLHLDINLMLTKQIIWKQIWKQILKTNTGNICK